MSKSKAPAGLADAGKRLWSAVVDKYDLRIDEQRTLEDACREADLIDLMASELAAGDLLITGSQGQKVVNPLVSELRQHRNTLAALMRQLKLPEDGDVDKEAGERSSKARAAAQARWARRGA